MAPVVPESHESDATVLGLDLESPLFVVAAILVSLGLALGVLRTRITIVLWAIAAFAVAFGILDLREAMHQVDEGRPVIAVVAIILLAMHAAMAIIAERLALMGDRQGQPA